MRCLIRNTIQCVVINFFKLIFMTADLEEIIELRLEHIAKLSIILYVVSIVFSCLFRLSFGGIVLRHYLEANVTRSTRTSIRYFMKMLANISETIIFMFLGLSAMVDTLDWNLSFIFFALLFCLVFRVLGNYTPYPSPFLF